MPLSNTSTSTSTSHLDPRVRRTRKLLEDAFKSLLRERPNDEISVGDVARRANVNRATFYAHYTDIRHFATEVLRASFEAALRESIAPGTPMNAETLTDFGASAFEFLDYFYGHASKLDSDKELNIARTFQETIQDFLSSWIRQDRNSMRLFPGSTAENAATALAWALYGGAARWSRLDPRPPAPQAAREIVVLLVR